MTLHMDGGDTNWKASGGDGDHVIDYPITIRSIFVYRGGIGRLSGAAVFDDLQVETGAPVRGVVLSRRGATTKALYTMTGTPTITAPVTGTGAFLVDGPGATTLAVSAGTVSVKLGTMPINVLSYPSGSTGPAAIHWVSGDRTTYTFQVLSGGALLRTISTGSVAEAGVRTARLGRDDRRSAGHRRDLPPARRGVRSRWSRLIPAKRTSRSPDRTDGATGGRVGCAAPVTSDLGDLELTTDTPAARRHPRLRPRAGARGCAAALGRTPRPVGRPALQRHHHRGRARHRGPDARPPRQRWLPGTMPSLPGSWRLRGPIGCDRCADRHGSSRRSSRCSCSVPCTWSSRRSV